MNEFDNTIVLFFNQYSHISTLLDKALVILSSNSLLKGAVISSLIWWVLFINKQDYIRNRQLIIYTIFSTILAVTTARILALILPMRLRPIHDNQINFTIPYDVQSDLLDGWSSMPSDHATLFCALSMGLYFASKKIGIFAFFYTIVIICLPRIYLGLHYPTDIIVGVFIGVSFTYIIVSNSILSSLNKKLLNYSLSHPSAFYTAVFLFTYQIADMFDTTRELLKAGHLFFKSVGIY